LAADWFAAQLNKGCAAIAAVTARDACVKNSRREFILAPFELG